MLHFKKEADKLNRSECRRIERANPTRRSEETDYASPKEEIEGIWDRPAVFRKG